VAPTQVEYLAQIFSDEHRREVWSAIGSLKQAALRGSNADLKDEDPRVFTSSAGLCLIYTIRPSEEGFLHHLSVSLPGRTQNAVGYVFLCMTTELLGIRPDSMGIYVSAATTHHTAVTLTVDQEEAFLAREVIRVSPRGLDSLQRICRDATDRVKWATDDRAR
jgi:hypothetical protein